jgi:hypothetical protein
VLALRLPERQAQLAQHEQTAYLLFMINAFQSLEDEMVRGQVRLTGQTAAQSLGLFCTRNAAIVEQTRQEQGCCLGDEIVRVQVRKAIKLCALCNDCFLVVLVTGGAK